MKMITVYHGSDRAIEEPVHTHGAYHDFGTGFYVAPSKELAHEWACRAAKDGIINSYTLHIEGLQVLDFTAKEHNLLEWAATVLKHRIDEAYVPVAEARRQYLIENFTVDISGYDLIYAWRADNSCFGFIQAFLSSTLSLERFIKVMQESNTGIELVLKTEKAVKALTFQKSEPAECARYWQENGGKERFVLPNEDEANRLMFQLCKDALPAMRNETYIIDMLREGMNHDDARLSRVLHAGGKG